MANHPVFWSTLISFNQCATAHTISSRTANGDELDNGNGVLLERVDNFCRRDGITEQIRTSVPTEGTSSEQVKKIQGDNWLIQVL